MRKRNRGKPHKKPQKVCIFCGGKPVTKEHFWPDWADDLLPKPAPHKHVEVFRTFTEITKLKGTQKQERPGNAHTKKIRAVCGPCNSGWMSALEDRVIPILAPLIKGEKFTITPEAQTLIARWIAMKAIVGEHNHPTEAVTQSLERERLRLSGQLPDNYQIWIAQCGQDGWETAYMRGTHTVSLTPTPAPGI